MRCIGSDNTVIRYAFVSPKGLQGFCAVDRDHYLDGIVCIKVYAHNKR